MQIKELLNKMGERNLKLATAESCTGGLVAAAITAVSGASDVFERGFVTYSNEAKTEMLGVPAKLIAAHGAVSAEVAKAMVKGAIKNSKANVAISLTGIAGPTGGTKEKPVGLVYIGIYFDGKIKVTKNNFPGGREEIRKAATAKAISLLGDLL